MNAIQFLMLSVAIFGIGAFTSLLLNGSNRSDRITTGLIGALASIFGLVAAIQAVVARPALFESPALVPFGHFSVQMDGLTSLMVGMISLLSLASSVYSISYLEKYHDRNLGALGFFTNLFVALMLLVVTTANAFYFLIFWEMMTLASYFLVTFESEKEESVRAGYLYMLIAHGGAMLIMLSFFIFYLNTGSFEFSDFRDMPLSPATRNLIFLLAFIGFGAKAGVVPLHIWLPRAHPAAPSHISALLSGVMIKTAIYGILRVCVDILGTSELWWGILVLFFGALSAVLGVFYAIAERDLKRFLAYSSIENVGIILLGMGTGMIGLATSQPLVALIGFLASLYHALNHSIFKGLLFMGAGSVDYRLNLRNLNQMGGLGRLMPWTGLTFLIGAMAVSAIPPMNGFVSEWLIFQSFFAASQGQDFLVRALMPLCSALLALVGTLSAMAAIKVFSGAFTGPFRREQTSQAREVPGMMVPVMAALAVGILLLGLGAAFIAPYLAGVVADFLNVPIAGEWAYPADMLGAVTSIPLIAILLSAFTIIPLAIIRISVGYRAGRRVVEAPWSCGYGYTPQMSLVASGFDQPVKVMFQPIYWLRTLVEKPYRKIASFSRSTLHWIGRAEPVVETVVTRPTARLVETAAQLIQALQMGDIRVYCLYIIVTLGVLLIAIFGRSGL